MGNLKSGQRYEVIHAFVDYYGNRFEVGEQLTYKSRDFLPYHGGHTIFFQERTMWFQEVENAGILQNMSAYLRPVSG